MRRTREAVLVVLGLSAMSTVVLAQELFRARADVVVVNAIVTRGGRAVPNLGAADFELRENGVRQSILDVTQGTAPLDVAVFVDVSFSVTPEDIAAIETAVATMSERLLPDDRLSVVTFSSILKSESDWTAPPLLLQMDGRSSGVGTSVVDAVLASMIGSSMPGRRDVVLLVTDADENSSFFDHATLRDTARYSNVVLYVLYVPHGGRRGNTYGLLREIAEQTGGEVMSLGNRRGLAPAFASAIAKVRSTYFLTYAPVDQLATGWRELSVRTTRTEHFVRARRGYSFAPQTK